MKEGNFVEPYLASVPFLVEVPPPQPPTQPTADAAPATGGLRPVLTRRGVVSRPCRPAKRPSGTAPLKTH